MHSINHLWSCLFSLDGTAGLTWPLIDSIRKYLSESPTELLCQNTLPARDWRWKIMNVFEKLIMCVKFPLSAIQLVTMSFTGNSCAFSGF